VNRRIKKHEIDPEEQKGRSNGMEHRGWGTKTSMDYSQKSKKGKKIKKKEQKKKQGAIRIGRNEGR